MTPDTKTKPRKARARVTQPNTNGTRASHSRKRQELARELATELKALRATMDEMIEHYRLRAGGQIGELLQAVEGDAAPGERAARPTAAVTQSLLEVMRGTRLKPRKGRAKDFARLQELIEELVALLPPEN